MVEEELDQPGLRMVFLGREEQALGPVLRVSVQSVCQKLLEVQCGWNVRTVCGCVVGGGCGAGRLKASRDQMGLKGQVKGTGKPLKAFSSRMTNGALWKGYFGCCGDWINGGQLIGCCSQGEMGCRDKRWRH
jgi:hypothetical protein